MEKNALKAAKDIMNKLEKRPIYKIIENIDGYPRINEKKNAISFKIIKEKLKSGYYTNSSMWVNDMNETFKKYREEFEKEEIKSVSLKSLFDFYEEELSKTYINDKSDIIIELKSLRNDIENYLQTKKGNRISFKLETNSGKEPGALIFSEPEENPINIKKLERDVKMLRNSNLILKIASFLYQMQPEAVQINENDVKIIYNKIKTENLKEFRKFVNQILKSAANGDLDPFNDT